MTFSKGDEVEIVVDVKKENEDISQCNGEVGIVKQRVEFSDTVGYLVEMKHISDRTEKKKQIILSEFQLQKVKGDRG